MAAESTVAPDLRPLNTFHVACRATRLHTLGQLDGLARARDFLSAHPDALILGGGSNLLLACDELPAVLAVRLRGRRVLGPDSEGVVIEVAAGESWHDTVLWSLAQGLAGLENLALIPGLCGAAPVQNIGAYGAELSDTLVAVRTLERPGGDVGWREAAGLGLGYRTSVLRQSPGRHLVLALRLRLQPLAQARLRLDYGDIRRQLQADGIERPTAGDVAQAVMAIRRARLPDPAVLGNAGSFFKNPLLEPDLAAALATRHPGMPAFAQPDGRVKIPAGWLIEQAGWKGHREGDAGVHRDHALVLVNHGQASGRQLLALARRIRLSVQQSHGILLEPEPVIIGARLDQAS
ncbi:MAG: UDP-N-acetylmuramate dehydrogenase [Burkholderiaceae bacterium]